MLGEQLSAATVYGGSGTAFVSGAALGTQLVFGLTPATWSVIGVIGGLVIGLLGFGCNAYFGWRRLQAELKANGDTHQTPRSHP